MFKYLIESNSKTEMKKWLEQYFVHVRTLCTAAASDAAAAVVATPAVTPPKPDETQKKTKRRVSRRSVTPQGLEAVPDAESMPKVHTTLSSTSLHDLIFWQRLTLFLLVLLLIMICVAGRSLMIMHLRLEHSDATLNSVVSQLQAVLTAQTDVMQTMNKLNNLPFKETGP